MPAYSEKSKAKLATCHPMLRTVFGAVIQAFDNTILCGHRGQKEQDAAFDSGRSRVKFPNGKHNQVPSLAVDTAPYPIDWKNIKRFIYFGGFVMGVAFALGIKLRWGGDWDSDTKLDDQNFNDYPHFELKED
ncbi:MAG: hypothetical protein RAO92_05775 [Candidatus Euphemobacter frigidus]|nr:hypothetical protein [Candidatus Euphemobacter frigidus]